MDENNAKDVDAAIEEIASGTDRLAVIILLPRDYGGDEGGRRAAPGVADWFEKLVNRADDLRSVVVQNAIADNVGVIIRALRAYGASTGLPPRDHSRLFGRAQIIAEWRDGQFQVIKRAAAVPDEGGTDQWRRASAPQVLHIHMPPGSRCEVIGNVAVVEPVTEERHVYVDLTKRMTDARRTEIEAAARSRAIDEAKLAVWTAIDPSFSGISRECADQAMAALDKMRK